MSLAVIGLDIHGEPPREGLAILARAGTLVGGKRQLALFPDHPAEKIAISGPLGHVFSVVRERLGQGGTVVVLADGDPLFYGIGARLIEEFGRESVAFFPSVSVLQAAAARLGFPWQDIPAVSLHGRSDRAPLFAALQRHRRVAVYTDQAFTPSVLAGALLERGAAATAMWVLEALGTREERIRRLMPEEAVGGVFDSLNMVILENDAPPLVPPCLGMPDELYEHEAGLITKGPVRAACIAALRLFPDATLWDLGAGSGAVAIEASTMLPRGRVVAVERDNARAGMIRANISRTHAWSVEVVHGIMPDCLAGLPAPDRIFLGGGIGRSSAVLEAATGRLAPGGRIVLSIVLLDSLARARDHLRALGWDAAVTMLQAAASAPLADDLRLAAMNPVFILAADKPGPSPETGVF